MLSWWRRRRVDALLPLLRIALRNEDFEAEAGLVDGTLAHAIERCLPIAARIGGFGVTETEIPAGSVAKTLIDFAPLPPVTDRQS
jgi:lipopolysaccharide biosynthesis protein